jgi:hypothetical protein
MRGSLRKVWYCGYDGRARRVVGKCGGSVQIQIYSQGWEDNQNFEDAVRSRDRSQFAADFWIEVDLFFLQVSQISEAMRFEIRALKPSDVFRVEILK